MSLHIQIKNGTWQGCPLSTLLYALCIEPQAVAIRLNPNITRVLVRNKEFNIYLRVDDVLLLSQIFTLPFQT